jgi:hypothetical protein
MNSVGSALATPGMRVAADARTAAAPRGFVMRFTSPPSIDERSGDRDGS